MTDLPSIAPASDTKTRILDATAAVLTQLPLSKVTMDDVARAAGVARQTIYKYYASRDDLVVALLVDETNRTHRPALVAMHRRARSAGQLTKMILEQLRLATGWVLLGRTFDPGLAPRMVELVLRSDALGRCVRALWVPILADYRDDGILRDDLDLDETVRWLTYQYVWLLSHPGALANDPDTLAHYIHTYLTSALVRRPAGPPPTTSAELRRRGSRAE